MLADIITQILLTLLTFVVLPILLKISICRRWFLISVIYTLKSDQWIKIWLAKFELECLLLILVFIYSSSKFKVTSKNADFPSELVPNQIRQKNLTLHSPFCIFPIKIL